MKPYAALLLLLLLGACSAIRLEQSITAEGSMSIEVQVSKDYDSTIIDVDSICGNFSTTEFFKAFSSPSCDDTGSTIIISGVRDIGKEEGFTVGFSFIESTYEFNSTQAFNSKLVSQDSLIWGSVPLKISYDSLGSGASISYIVEMPSEVSKVRNGEIFGAKKAKFDLVDLSLKKRGVYVESKEANWKFLASLVVFLVMLVGILVVWLSYFYLKGKT